MKLIKRLWVFVALIIVFVFADNVYSANELQTRQDGKGCYYVEYTVGDQKARTNSVCFDETTDAMSNKKVVYLSQSDGASDPIVTSKGKLYMEIVGRNPSYNILNEEKGEYEIKGSELIRPNGDKSATASGDSPIVEVVAKFDDEAGQVVSSASLENGNFDDQNTRKDSFDRFANMIANEQFAAAYSQLEPAGVAIDDAKTEESAPDERKDEEQPEDYGDDEEVCYENSGKLGWIICPVISGISGIGEWLWGEVETNFLQLSVEDFFKKNDGIEKAWAIFRDMANVIFIIFFLIVIFSQLTGVGIDSYGIKKILPKLIITAILINLSYLICVLAVDLSNILGSGLNSLFTSMASSIEVTTVEASPGASIAAAGLGGGGLVLFSLLTTPLGAVTLAGAIAAVGLTVLGIAISLMVSILFLFLVLMIRNAGIVILIAIAPIAIVCYMLPNTEKFYKKWFDLLKSLLFVYPICGALVGAGKLAGNILASTGTEAMTIAGMIVEVLPFFLIPTLLKQSLSLAGNIGAKLSATGKSLGRRGSTTARGAITNSGRFKDWSQVQAANKAGRIQRRLEGKVNRGGTLSRWQRAKLRAAQDTVLAQNKAEEENKLRATGGYTEAMTYKQNMATRAETEAISRLNDPTVRKAEAQAMADEARLKRDKARTTLMMNETKGEGLEQLMNRWNTAFDGGNSDDLSALTNVINQRYGATGANSIASSLSTKTNIANNQNYQNSMKALQQTMSDNASLAGNMKTKAPDAYQMIGDAGMRYDKGTNSMVQEDMSYFTKNNKVATKLSDWANVSGDTLQRAIDEGTISTDTMQKLLTSDDPSIASGIQSEEGKRQTLEAGVYNRENGTSLSNAAASNAYQANQQSMQQRQQWEDDATRIGKSTINVPPGLTISGGTPAKTIQGYAAPASFNTNGQAPMFDAKSNQYYYKEYDKSGKETGGKWNVTTGRYISK